MYKTVEIFSKWISKVSYDVLYHWQPIRCVSGWSAPWRHCQSFIQIPVTVTNGGKIGWLGKPCFMLTVGDGSGITQPPHPSTTQTMLPPPPLQTTTGAWIMLQLTSYVQSVRGIGGRNSMAKKVQNFFPLKKKFWKHLDLTWLLRKFQHFSKEFVLHRNFYLPLKISMVTTWLATETRISSKQEYFSVYWWSNHARLPTYLPRFSQLGNHPFRNYKFSELINSLKQSEHFITFDQTC